MLTFFIVCFMTEINLINHNAARYGIYTDQYRYLMFVFHPAMICTYSFSFRRLNVAITRGRHMVWVLGNAKMLARANDVSGEMAFNEWILLLDNTPIVTVRGGSGLASFCFLNSTSRHRDVIYHTLPTQIQS